MKAVLDVAGSTLQARWRASCVSVFCECGGSWTVQVLTYKPPSFFFQRHCFTPVLCVPQVRDFSSLSLLRCLGSPSSLSPPLCSSNVYLVHYQQFLPHIMHSCARLRSTLSLLSTSHTVHIRIERSRPLALSSNQFLSDLVLLCLSLILRALSLSSPLYIVMKPPFFWSSCLPGYIYAQYRLRCDVIPDCTSLSGSNGLCL